MNSQFSISGSRCIQLRYFLTALVSLSIAAACIENGLHPLVLLAVPFIYVALTRPDVTKSFIFSEKAWTVILLLYIAVLPGAVKMLKGWLSMPLFFVYFTFGTLLVRVVSPLSDRHVSQIVFLTAGLTIINCILTNDMLFGLLLPFYLFALMATLLFFHLAQNHDHFGEIADLPATGALRNRWYGRLLVYVFILLAFTGLMFVVFPRPFVVLPGLTSTAVHTGRTAALAQRISYRDMVSMAGRHRIAFVVNLEQGKLPNYPYWRGKVLETNDGRGWTSIERVRGMGHFIRATDSEVMVYRITPYRLQSRTVYVTGVPLLVTGGMRRPLQITSRGEVLVDTAILVSDTYKVRALDRPMPASGREISTNIDGAGVTARIRSLARQWTSGLASDKEKALALTSRLKREFKYQLYPAPPPEDANPAEYFLFEAREGHCEYFAGALCLMLRSLGIPARVVEGFAGFERTDDVAELIVRFANAHAWVEAILDNSGWTTLDPTPPAPEETGYTLLARILGDAYDWLDYQWIRNVVHFDRSDQSRAYQGLADLFSGKAPSLFMVSEAGRRYVAPVAAVAALLIVLGLLSHRRSRKRDDLAGVYLSTMEKLVKMGVLQRVYPWHEDNVSEIERRAPFAADALARFMSKYFQGRFGGPPGCSTQELKNAAADLLETAASHEKIT